MHLLPGGVNGLEPAEFNLRFHRQFTSQVQPNKRVAVFHFPNDEIFGRWQKEAIEISFANLGNRRNAMVRVPPLVTGHEGMNKFYFIDTYGRCIAEFLAADEPNERICRSD